MLKRLLAPHLVAGSLNKRQHIVRSDHIFTVPNRVIDFKSNDPHPGTSNVSLSGGLRSACGALRDRPTFEA
jgi:hypothetical protein